MIAARNKRVALDQMDGIMEKMMKEKKIVRKTVDEMMEKKLEKKIVKIRRSQP